MRLPPGPSNQGPGPPRGSNWGTEGPLSQVRLGLASRLQGKQQPHPAGPRTTPSRTADGSRNLNVRTDREAPVAGARLGAQLSPGFRSSWQPEPPGGRRATADNDRGRTTRARDPPPAARRTGGR